MDIHLNLIRNQETYVPIAKSTKRNFATLVNTSNVEMVLLDKKIRQEKPSEGILKKITKVFINYINSEKTKSLVNLNIESYVNSVKTISQEHNKYEVLFKTIKEDLKDASALENVGVLEREKAIDEVIYSFAQRTQDKTFANDILAGRNVFIFKNAIDDDSLGEEALYRLNTFGEKGLITSLVKSVNLFSAKGEESAKASINIAKTCTLFETDGRHDLSELFLKELKKNPNLSTIAEEAQVMKKYDTPLLFANAYIQDSPQKGEAFFASWIKGMDHKEKSSLLKEIRSLKLNNADSLIRLIYKENIASGMKLNTEGALQGHLLTQFIITGFKNAKSDQDKILFAEELIKNFNEQPNSELTIGAFDYLSKKLNKNEKNIFLEASRDSSNTSLKESPAYQLMHLAVFTGLTPKKIGEKSLSDEVLSTTKSVAATPLTEVLSTTKGVAATPVTDNVVKVAFDDYKRLGSRLTVNNKRQITEADSDKGNLHCYNKMQNRLEIVFGKEATPFLICTANQTIGVSTTDALNKELNARYGTDMVNFTPGRDPSTDQYTLDISKKGDLAVITLKQTIKLIDPQYSSATDNVLGTIDVIKTISVPIKEIPQFTAGNTDNLEEAFSPEKNKNLKSTLTFGSFNLVSKAHYAPYFGK